MRSIIGRKVGMTQIYDAEGNFVPVSIIQAGPCPVVQVKSKKREGYDAVQIAFSEKRPTKARRSEIGHCRKAGLPVYRHLQEFRVENAGEYAAGQVIDVTVFKDVAKVDVTGLSKGKGFTGATKRHHFVGGPNTHGSKSHDVPGSIGSSAHPSRVWKGKKLPGRMGGTQFTIKNLKVVEIDAENNLLLVRGAVPGAVNTILRVTASS